MKRHMKTILGLILVVALLCVGCSGSGNNASPKNISELPEYTKLSALIGCSMEEVLTKMGWTAEELVEEEFCNYKTPLTVEYAGVSFRVWLMLGNAEQRIRWVTYRAEYENAAETAAKDILQVSQKLGSAIGQNTEAETQGLDIAIFEMTEAQMQETLATKKLKKAIRWNLNEVADASHKDYMNMLKDLETWEKYRDRQPQYCLEMSFSYIEELNTVYLLLNLGIQPEVPK